ncbi:metal-sulfur cluster assembly factor [Labedaea rhizosphaerae]|uniref:Metal-sulfur cluster biosynthetic enzyme n=1 Tax=Labedaea rhizosphaerae TaxID=598644 RepID=A0A4R6SAV3_LABRH|nr:metal-sulfur cluster assembly factor [Labedaea rhizosphaerae]TDP96684.1 metal-sulfur cluster biosynthetic enzyme [Labedaea rhizosphaerae]
MTAIDPGVHEALRGVYDPCCREKGISVADMGLLQRAEIADGHAEVDLVLTSGWCPFASNVLTEVEHAVRALPGVASARVRVVWDEAWSPGRLSDDARAKLRFLPSPKAVGDRDAFVALKTAERPAESSGGAR